MNTPTPHTRENPKLGNKKYGKKGGFSEWTVHLKKMCKACIYIMKDVAVQVCVIFFQSICEAKGLAMDVMCVAQPKKK